MAEEILKAILIGIPLIGVLIVVHELGHFLVAKWCGVGVLRFAIGFGPTLWRKRIGETEYQIGIIPLGGYVRMMGDMPDLLTGDQPGDQAVRGEVESAEEIPPEVKRIFDDRSRWFVEKGLLARSAIVIAGPLFNFVTAFLFALLAVYIYGEAIPLREARIGSVDPRSPAEKAGLTEGDFVLAVDGEEIAEWEQLAMKIRRGTGAPISLKVRRPEGQVDVVSIQPQPREELDENGAQAKFYRIGIASSATRQEADLSRSALIAIRWTGMVAWKTVTGIWGMIVGTVSTKELGGPILIFATARSQAEKGWEAILTFTAALSVSLAVLNLLPIPLLDGGHLLFFFLEAILGPLSMRKRELAQNFGLAFLLFLMVFALFNDVGRIRRNQMAIGGWEEVEEAER